MKLMKDLWEMFPRFVYVFNAVATCGDVQCVSGFCIRENSIAEAKTKAEQVFASHNASGCTYTLSNPAIVRIHHTGI